MSTGTAIAIALVLLGANAFFVAAEFALIAARRTAVEARAAEGSKTARTTLRAMERVSVMMAGAQLGITLCSLGLGALGEPAVAHVIEPLFTALGLPAGAVHGISFVIALSIVVFAHVVFGEMVPKNLTLAAPDRAALVLSRPMTAIVAILRPFIAVLNATANGLLRIMGVTPQDEVAAAFTREEVAALVSQSHREGLLDEDEHDLVSGVLALDESPVARVMLPVQQLVTVPADANADAIEAVAVETGYSRVPVIDDAGAITGYVHIKDLIGLDDDPVTAMDLARPMAVIDASDDLRDALEAMRVSGAHLGSVEDDGRMIGVVALEDVLEELVGEIRDATHRA